MKKLFFMAAMAAVSVFTAKAQNNEMPTATLQHGEQTLVFTGIDALRSAYTAAADSGDVITLSSGYFNSFSDRITKSISVYGAGFEDNAETGKKATVLNGGFYLQHGDVTDEDGNVITGGRKVNGSHFEGLLINGSINLFNDISNIEFVKCNLNSLAIYNGCENIICKQSVLYHIYGRGTSNEFISNLYITNSHFDRIYYFSQSSTCTVDHCVVTGSPTLNALYTNNILYSSLPSSSTAKNNIFVGTDASIGTGVQDLNNNWIGVANAGVWAAEGEDGSYAEDKTFELKYPEKYIGTDGTQVGLHGGNYPWNKVPCTPQIVESDIDTKTSADGKLKVSIKVEAQTKE